MSLPTETATAPLTPTRLRPVLRHTLGGLLWAGLTVWGALQLLGTGDARQSSVADRVWWYAFEKPTELRIVFPDPILCPRGTRLVVRNGDIFRPIGEVMSTEPGPGYRKTVVAAVAPEYATMLGRDTRATLLSAPGTVAWLMHVLLPDHIREQVRRDLDILSRIHRDDVIRVFWPYVEDAARDVFALLKEDFRDSILRHRDELDAILHRHHTETVEKELLPLFQTEIWPRLTVALQPAIEELGRDLWQRLPLWAITWKWAYAKLPGTPDNAHELRFNQFMQEEAIPLLEARQDALLEVVTRAAQSIAEVPKVRQVFRQAVEAVVNDPQLIALINEIATETVLANPRLNALLLETWDDPRLQSEVREFSARIQPQIDRLLDRILLNDTGNGVNPNLVRVLRTEVLGKDTTWILIEPAPDDQPPAAGEPLILEGEKDTWS